MGRCTGETIAVQFGARWTYKLRIEEEREGGPRTSLVLGTKAFDSEQEAKAAGDAHLREEISKHSGKE